MNQRKNLKRFTAIMGHLQDALAEARMLETEVSGVLSGDVSYYIQEIESLISCDQGESGLEPLIEKLMREAKP